MEHEKWYTPTLLPSYFRRERKKREWRAAIHLALAMICSVSAAVLILRGNIFATVAAAGVGTSVVNLKCELRRIRELETDEARAREIQLAAILEAHKRFEERERFEEQEAGEGETRTPSTAPAIPLPREGGFTGEPYGVTRVSGRVIHLAFRHRKARVRKKNANRIIKEEERK